MTKLLSQLQASTGIADNDLLHQGDTSAGDDKKLTMAELRAYLDGYYAELSRPNRNLIANGSFRVNQQGSTSKTETNPGWNYDTWYYTGTHLETFVEEADIFDGTFTLSWESDATAEWALADTATGAIVGTWASVSNGGNFTLTDTAGNHLWVRFSAGTAGLNALDLVQLEVGSVATDFERRPIANDLQYVQRYLLRFGLGIDGYAAVASIAKVSGYFVHEMRDVPSLALTDTSISANTPSLQTSSASTISNELVSGKAFLFDLDGFSGMSGGDPVIVRQDFLEADARPPIPV